MEEAFATWFLYFVIFSFLGWLCETVYCSIPAGHFINRGFLNGPFCPIYGVGGVVTIAVLNPFATAPGMIFLLGLVWTTLLEYVTSWGMEVLFHYRWWDYSNRFMNIRGRVCLLNSILFGLLCVVLMLFIHPPIQRLLESLPPDLKTALAIVFAVFLAADLAVTVKSVLNLNQRLAKLHALRDEIRAGMEASILKFRKLVGEKRIFQHRLIRSYPQMRSLSYNEHLQIIRRAIMTRKRKR